MSDDPELTDRFSANLRTLLSMVQYRRARTGDDLEAIYRLRYEANHREGAIAASEIKKLEDRFDHTPNVMNFGIFIDDVLMVALRLNVLTPEHAYSPALEAFPDLLTDHVQKGARIIDGNRFVANYPAVRAYPHLPYVTLRLAILAAQHFECKLIAASMRAEHYPFYKREYLAEKLCEPRSYPTLIKTVLLTLIDLDKNGSVILGRRPIYASTAAEREALFGPAEQFLPASADKQFA